MLSATTTGTANITRAVTCVNAVSNQPASLAKCQALAGPRPDDIRLVTGTKRCGFDFSAGEWLPCSTACGSGVENRVVTCKRSDGANPEHQSNPSTPAGCPHDVCHGVAGCRGLARVLFLRRVLLLSADSSVERLWRRLRAAANDDLQALRQHHGRRGLLQPAARALA